jgi:protease-4
MSELRDGLLRGLGMSMGLAIGLFLFVGLGIVLLAMFAVGLGAGLSQAGFGGPAPGATGYTYVSGSRTSKNKLLSVRVSGVILGSPSREFGVPVFGEATFGYSVRRVLDEAANDAAIRGVLLHVQTPGGTIFGSRAIHEAVVAYRKKSSRPVVAYVEGLSASGGVMAMVGADKIYADHGSLVGSIGVIGPQWLFFNKPVAVDGGLFGQGITTKDGIEQTIITAGRSKDLGNPFRRPTAEELQVLQRAIDEEYALFVRHVAASRKIEEATIRDEMGAHVFDNAEAQRYGLIDGTLDKPGAFTALADLAKVGRDYQVVRPVMEHPSLLAQMLSARFAVVAQSDPGAFAEAQRAVRLEVCAAAERYPLAYHGDPSALCR